MMLPGTISTVLEHGSRLRPGARLAQSSSSQHRRYVLAAALLLIPLLLLATLWEHRPAQSLSQTVLTGPRGPQCLRVLVANDVSGSMSSYTAARQAALSQFLTWAPRQLRPDDEIGVIDFAGDATWARTPDPVTNATGPSPARGLTGGGTALHPVLDVAATAPATTCRTWLLLLSDGHLSDTPATDVHARQALAAAGIDEVSLLVPDPSITVPPAWENALPFAAPVHVEGTDADDTALVYGRLTAALTGQKLTRDS